MGTADARERASARRFVAGPDARSCTYRSLDQAGSAFDPTATSAQSSAYDEFSLLVSQPRKIAQGNEVGEGKYTAQDARCMACAADFEAAGVVPKTKDIVKFSGNESWEVLDVDLRWGRGLAVLFLRRMGDLIL